MIPISSRSDEPFTPTKVSSSLCCYHDYIFVLKLVEEIGILLVLEGALELRTHAQVGHLVH